GGGTQTAFGPRGSANVLSRATTILAGVFMVTSLGLSMLRPHESSILDRVNGPSTAPSPSVPAPKAPAAAPVTSTAPASTTARPRPRPRAAPAPRPPSTAGAPRPRGSSAGGPAPKGRRLPERAIRSGTNSFTPKLNSGGTYWPPLDAAAAAAGWTVKGSFTSS